MSAILDAATGLFAEKGVAAVSIRDIAAKADVNHGLIYRHFGTKENLRLRVQDRLMKQINDDIGEPKNFADALLEGVRALRKNDTFWKVLARTLLDGQFEGGVQSSFPFLRRMVDSIGMAQLQGAIDSDIDPRVIVAGGVAMVLGLLVFENYILPGTGLDAGSHRATQDEVLSAFLNNLL